MAEGLSIFLGKSIEQADRLFRESELIIRASRDLREESDRLRAAAEGLKLRPRTKKVARGA